MKVGNGLQVIDQKDNPSLKRNKTRQMGDQHFLHFPALNNNRIAFRKHRSQNLELSKVLD